MTFIFSTFSWRAATMLLPYADYCKGDFIPSLSASSSNSLPPMPGIPASIERFTPWPSTFRSPMSSWDGYCVLRISVREEFGREFVLVAATKSKKSTFFHLGLWGDGKQKACENKMCSWNLHLSLDYSSDWAGFKTLPPPFSCGWGTNLMTLFRRIPSSAGQDAENKQ